jgi:uncharacterized membrane protein YqhA
MTADTQLDPSTGGTSTCEPDSYSRTASIITNSSRLMFILAVTGTALASVTLFIYGFIFTCITVFDAFSDPHFASEGIKELMAIFIETIDLFLVATVFFIISLGLYELFIAKAPLPGWLKICNLDDLKTKLLGLVIIALAVLILGEALTWNGTADILAFGLATSAGIGAISVYIWVKN